MRNDINVVLLSGVIATEPRFTKRSSGSSLCLFTLKVVSSFKSEVERVEQVAMVNCTIVGANADYHENKLQVEDEITIQGVLNVNKEGSVQVRIKVLSNHSERLISDETH